MDTASNTPATRNQPEGERKPLMGLTFLDNLAQLPMLRQFGLLVGLAARKREKPKKSRERRKDRKGF